ncbi:MAG: MBL fold metallo-hydrolase [Gemmataceae bacterium]|nr:MBL fold metallo-hydrolase [Gemmataceae bacterium]
MSLSARAQDKKPVLRWLGQSFFVLETSKGTKIAFDPHAIEAFGRPVARADLVLISHPHPDHTRLESIENRATAKVLEGVKMAGEGGRSSRSVWNPVDETFRDVKVRNVGVFHDSSQGALRGRNSVFIVEFDGLTLAHLGDLGHQLSEEQLRQIGPVDVLLVPVGGVYTLNGDQAKRVVAAIKPRRYILPMHYGNKIFDDVLPADEFLEGQTNVKRMPSTNELPLDASLPAKDPVIVVLGPKKE